MGSGATQVSADAVTRQLPVTALALILASLTVGAFALWFAGRRRAVPAEDPRRVSEFLQSLSKLDWAPEATFASMEKTYSAVTALFEAEIRYYYGARKIRRRVSFVGRAGAYLFGTGGLLCPLLANAVPHWDGLTRFGYLFFAAAAACLAGNELFGGTFGHIRAVNTQYKIEHLMTKFTIQWQRWRSTRENSADSGKPDKIEEGFALLRDLAEHVYAELSDETAEWGSVIIKSTDAYRDRINTHGSG